MTPATRIVGIDIARGLAVLGMFGAHVGVISPFDWLQPDTWTGVVNGRSSILFAMLAGVSIAIISGRRVPASGVELSRIRFRIGARAILVFIIGLLLVLLGTNVAVILPVYAVLFLMALPFLRMPPLALFAIALGVAIAVPVLLAAVGPAVEDSPNIGIALISYFFLTGSYPALLWIVFVLAGLGIGRLNLTARNLQVRLLLAGITLAVLGYGAGELSVSAFGSSDLITTQPHSGSPFEVIGSLGFAVAVLALCLLASRVIHRPLYPVEAVGSMALSAYSLQIVAIALIGAEVPGDSDNALWLVFVAVALAVAPLWKYFIGRGPLEWLVTVSARGASRLVPADRLDPASPQKRNTES